MSISDRCRGADRRPVVIFCLIILCGLPARLWADSGRDWLLCGDALQLPTRPPIEETELDPELVYASGDEADLVEGGVSVLKGNVHVHRDTRQMTADKLIYDEPRALMDAKGNVQLWDEGVYLAGQQGEMNLETDQVAVDDARFTLMESHAHGEATRIVATGSELLHAEKTRYTTCNPGDEDWVLEADQIDLNRVTDVGTARHVVVRIMSVPVFYSPFLTFPLSDARKSGFLAPSFGNTDEGGFEVTVPYYWNIAPNMDATFGARTMVERGVMGIGEFRYLTHRGAGVMGLEYMPKDDVFGEDRGAFSFRHEGEFAPYWDAEITLNHVTDKEYFEDLGTDLDIASTRFLDRRIDVGYRRSGWYVLGRAQTYQTIDKTIDARARPYKRLPQLRVIRSTAERNRRFNLELRSEAVRFDRDSSVTGTRLDLRPTVSFPLRTASTFLIPRLSVRHTQYYLDDNPPGIAQTPDRTVPTFTLDGGVFLERKFAFQSKDYVQTLEPRIYYLAVPFEDQDDLPVFDTGQFSFNFAQLFRDDRFSGADRVGDAHQVSLALTTRLLDPKNGDELLRASVGQIRHFRDRKVTLPGRAPETQRSSDIVAELAGSIGVWRASAGLQWNTSDSQTGKSTVAVRYQPDVRRVINASYRFVRDEVEQTDLSFSWPLARNWNSVGRYNYSLVGNRMLEGFIGFEYDSCCWAARAIARRYLTNTEGEFSNAFFLQLELKGLTGIGRSAGEFLRSSIPGFHDDL